MPVRSSFSARWSARWLMVALLLPMLLPPAPVLNAQTVQGPAVRIMSPSEDERVVGPELRVKIEIAKGSGADIVRSSLAITATSRITSVVLTTQLPGLFQWDDTTGTVSATLREPTHLPLGTYTLRVRIQDQNGRDGTADRAFQFAVPNSLAKLLAQRAGGEWTRFVAFEDVRSAISDSMARWPYGIYVEPETGECCWLTKALRKTFGRTDWLPDSPDKWQDRVAEVSQIAEQLKWKAVPVASYYHGDAVMRRNSATSRVPRDHPAAVKLAAQQGPYLMEYARQGISDAPVTDAAQPPRSELCVVGPCSFTTGEGGGWSSAGSFDDINGQPCNANDGYYCSWLIEGHYHADRGWVRLDLSPYYSATYGVAEVRLVFGSPYVVWRTDVFTNGGWSTSSFLTSPFDVTAGARRGPPPSTNADLWDLPPRGKITVQPRYTDTNRVIAPTLTPPYLAVDPALVVSFPMTNSRSFAGDSLYLQVRLDDYLLANPACPVPADDFQWCSSTESGVRFDAAPTLIYREDFPRLELPLVKTIRCGPAEWQRFDWAPDADHDFLPESWENSGWTNLAGRWSTDPNNCDSVGNGLKDGEAKRWDQPRNSVIPVFERPDEGRLRTGSWMREWKWGSAGGVVTRTVLPGVMAPQEWYLEAAKDNATSGAAAFQLSSRISGPWIFPDTGREPSVTDWFGNIWYSRCDRWGWVDISLSSENLKYETRNDRGEFTIGNFALGVVPRLCPPKAVLDSADLRHTSLRVSTTLAVAFDFLAADEANRFIVSDTDRPGLSPMLIPWLPPTPDVVTQAIKTPPQIKEAGVEVGLFKIKNADVGGNNEWEVGVGPVEAKINLGTDATSTSGAQTAEWFRAENRMVQHFDPPELLVDYRGGADPLTGYSLKTTSWHLPWQVRTTLAANPRDALRVHLTGRLDWSVNRYGSLLAEVPFAYKLSSRTWYAGSDFIDVVFYVMLRRNDWYCAKCVSVRSQRALSAPARAADSPISASSVGLLGRQAGESLPPAPVSRSVASPTVGSSITRATLDDAPPDIPSLVTPTLNLVSMTVTPTVASGYTATNTLRTGWTIGSTSATPATGYVDVAVSGRQTGSSGTTRYLLGPLALTDAGTSQSVDVPVPAAGTYDIGVGLFDGGLQLQMAQTVTATTTSGRPVTPSLQLESTTGSVSGMVGSVAWTATNVTTTAQSVSAVGALRDAKDNVVEVVAGTTSTVPANGSSGGTLTFAPVVTPGMYTANVVLRDATNRVLGGRRIPLAIGVPASKLTGSYVDASDGTPASVLTETVGVQAGTTGLYRVSAELYAPDGKFIGQANNVANLSSGPGSVSLGFDGLTIGRSERPGPYQLRNVELRDQDGALLDLAAGPYTTTASYPLGTFPAPTAKVGGPYADGGTLTTVDNKFGALGVDATVTATAAGRFVVTADLTDPSDGHVAETTTAQNLVTGTNTVRLLFPGSEIAGTGLDGPYTVGDLRVLDPNGVEQDWVASAYTTSAYRASQFAGRGAQLAPTLSHRLMLANGVPRAIAVTAGVTVARPGLYEIEAVMRDQRGQQLWAMANPYLSAGAQQVELLFDLSGIDTAGLASPLTLEQIRLTDPVGLTPLLDRRVNVYTIDSLSLPRSYVPVVMVP